MLPLLARIAHDQRGVFTRSQALAAGYSAQEVRTRVAKGEWVALRRGVLCTERARAAAVGARDRHLLLAAAAVASSSLPSLISHRSAAVLWDLPLLGGLPTDVALTVEHQHRRRSPGLELHTARTPETHQAMTEGLPVTSVARTLSDLARSVTFACAVVAADHALHRALCTSRDLENVIADCPVWPGIARTKRLVAFADRRSESPGESLSRVAIASADLPMPEPQVELLLAGRRLRVDFLWTAQRVVGEFDGRVKYGASEDLWDEKLREDLLRRHDYRVVRWTWGDVYPSFDPLVGRLAAALAL